MSNLFHGVCDPFDVQRSDLTLELLIDKDSDQVFVDYLISVAAHIIRESL